RRGREVREGGKWVWGTEARGGTTATEPPLHRLRRAARSLTRRRVGSAVAFGVPAQLEAGAAGSPGYSVRRGSGPASRPTRSEGYPRTSVSSSRRRNRRKASRTRWGAVLGAVVDGACPRCAP